MTEAPSCPQCRATIPSDAPDGLCPKCLMKRCLEAGDPARPGRRPPAPATQKRPGRAS